MTTISRTKSLLICLSGYLFALLIICFLFKLTGPFKNILLATLVLDLAATFLIFLLSVIFNNSSFYDPFWSLAPLPILLVWSSHAKIPAVNPERQWIIIALILIWAFRLTFNCVRRWKGMGDEDWRYSMHRSHSRLIYWLISLVGFHVFPTLIVFAGCLSVYPSMSLLTQPMGITDGIALIMTLSGIAIEMIADQQLKDFLRNKPDKAFLSTGLWKYSRHPNYFGEILFWTGLSVFSLKTNPFAWYIPVGPLAMILMFSLISVPLMDKRMLKNKPGYKEYLKKTSGLIPWFKL
jgi:steroid 5-alpha reductase family enzyme